MVDAVRSITEIDDYKCAAFQPGLELTQCMRQAVARDAEAERDRRSKVIAAGESEAAAALNHADAVMAPARGDEP